LKFPEGPAQFDSGSLPWLAMRLYREFRQRDNLTPLAIEGLTLELLVGAARQSAHVLKNGATGWLKKARHFLHQRFHEPFTLGDVAEFSGVHPVSLARAFRRTYRCTVGEYVRKLRIEFACQQLTASDASLVEIAFSAGFSEQSHLCRTFKRLTGLTPSEYRSNSRQG
jgi:AraC-like DNA-binding protein